MKAAVVGALTLDYLSASNEPMIGGPPVYAGLALKALGVPVKAYTAVGEDFPQAYIHSLSSLGLELSVTRLQDRPSYSFKAVFTGGKRKLSIFSEGPQIPLYAIKDLRADAVVASPVFKEIGIEHLSFLREKADVLVVDLQGFLRHVNEDGFVGLSPLDSKEITKLADVVHCSEEEAAVLTGHGRPAEVAEAFQRWEVKTALVGYAEGLLVVTENGCMFFMTENRYTPTDTTGAGDMLTGAFTALRLRGLHVEEAAAKALGYVHFWLRYPAPFRAADLPQNQLPDVKVVWRRTAFQIP